MCRLQIIWIYCGLISTDNGVVTARTARLRGVLLAQSLVAREYGFVYWASRLTRKQRERSEGQTRPRGIEELEADIPPRTESPPPTPEDREEEEREAERQRSQKKRKGKMLAHLVQKKPGVPSHKLIIQGSSQLTLARNRVLIDDSEEEKEAERPQEEEEVVSAYNRFFSKVDRKILKRMPRFDDPKQEEECVARISRGRIVKSGKMIGSFFPA